MVFDSDISYSEKKFTIEGCIENCREDGRGRDESRQYAVIVDSCNAETSLDDDVVLVLSNGSARVMLGSGETHILVSVKADLVHPSLEVPGEGVMEIHVDRAEKRDEELESLLSTLLLPHLIETTELCIVPAHYVWQIHLDVLIVTSHGGSVIDACTQGISAALGSTLLPNLSVITSAGREKPTLQVDNDVTTSRRITPFAKVPSIVTVTILDCPSRVFLIDANRNEESCALEQIHVVVENSNDSPKICALHKAGGGSLTFSLLQEVTSFVLQSNFTIEYVSAISRENFLQAAFQLQY